ncbi:MAG: hypothetical protein RR228_00525 [Bacilli bacterium]
MIRYILNNKNMLLLSENLKGNDGNDRSSYKFISSYIDRNCAIFLLTRNLFKKLIKLENKGNPTTTVDDENNIMLYNKGIVYYFLPSSTRDNNSDYEVFNIIEGMYHKDKNGNPVFDVKSFIFLKSDSIGKKFDVKITEVVDKKTHYYQSDNEVIPYETFNYNVTNMHYRDGEVFKSFYDKSSEVEDYNIRRFKKENIVDLGRFSKRW